MNFFTHLLHILNEMSPYILFGFLIAGIMHSFIPRRTFARHLSGRGWKAVVKAALIGVPLPLCSCGVLPTAIAMKRGGASRAATTSFLVATPQTGVDSIAATWSLLGPAFAIIRPFAALVTAIGGGVAVGKNEQTVSNEPTQVCTVGDAAISMDDTPQTFWQKALGALRYGFIDLVGSIGGWLVTGLIIAALITVFVPSDFFTFLGRTPILAMIAVLIVAIPMYVCATGSIPIAMSLVMKGLSPGTALVLLMAGPAANFASFTLISREMGRRSALIYLASIIVGSIAFGLAIDYLLPASWFAIGDMGGAHSHGHGFSVFPTVCSAVLVALLCYTLAKRYIFQSTTITNKSEMTKEYIIKGMNCPHCQATVTRSIGAVEGVEAVDVNLSEGRATVEGEHNADDVIAAVNAAGFEALPA